MSRTTHFEGRFLRLVAEGRWEFCERTRASGVVAIVAVTPDERLLLVEQFRPPVGCPVIEIPAGLAGDIDGAEHEQLAEAARRELVEETGYEATQMTYLGHGPSSAGLTSEVLTFFAATGLRRSGPVQGDGGEQITLHEVPLAGLREWLSAQEQRGCLIDPKIWSSLAMSGRVVR